MAKPSNYPRVSDVHVRNYRPLPSPAELQREFPVEESLLQRIAKQRAEIAEIVHGRDGRMLGLVGPCSIHDPDAALDYARRFSKLRDTVSDKIYLAMRVYFEKPRTRVGWKGLIPDPFLDGSDNLLEGIRLARRLLVDIASLGLPTGSEMLDPIVPQYISDLISWASIGARTTESQTHRHLASGLSMPVGFKNGIDGHIGSAVNALVAAREPHCFLGVDRDGRIAAIRTDGNPDAHIILRGGRGGPNYGDEDFNEAESLLDSVGSRPAIMVDCSHANSNKKYEKQVEILRQVVDMRVAGRRSIVGFMLESNLEPGRQDIPKNLKDLKYGVSITDPCLGWDGTEAIIRETYEALKAQG